MKYISRRQIQEFQLKLSASTTEMITFFVYCVIGIGTLLLVTRLYKKGKLKWNGSYTCLMGKTAIITGSNTGLGYMTALDFAMRGARVILACRNAEKAELARQKIIKSTGNHNIAVKIVDMTSLESVRKFACDINASEGRLDILVNNAGVSEILGVSKTKDGLQPVMQTNHLSPFLLTHLLLEKLKKSAPSRIVTVSSWMAFLGKLNPEYLNEAPNFCKPLMQAILYANTKLCNLVFTIKLAEKLKGTGVTANVVDPGTILTQIFDSVPLCVYCMLTFLKMILKNVKEGAQSTIYVSVSKDLDEVSGKFFGNCEEKRYYPRARKEHFVEQVWKKSEELVELKEEEKIQQLL